MLKNVIKENEKLFNSSLILFISSPQRPIAYPMEMFIVWVVKTSHIVHHCIYNLLLQTTRPKLEKNHNGFTDLILLSSVLVPRMKAVWHTKSNAFAVFV